VDLRALYPAAASVRESAEVCDGLIVSEVVPGALERWIRTASGDWLGEVNVVFTRADGSTYKAMSQLIPAQALSPR